MQAGLESLGDRFQRGGSNSELKLSETHYP